MFYTRGYYVLTDVALKCSDIELSELLRFLIQY